MSDSEFSDLESTMLTAIGSLSGMVELLKRENYKNATNDCADIFTIIQVISSIYQNYFKLSNEEAIQRALRFIEEEIKAGRCKKMIHDKAAH